MTTNNATVRTYKQEITQDGKVVRSLYYIEIKTETGEMTINTGEKNYEKVQKMTAPATQMKLDLNLNKK